ncbi:hypothetical protein CCMSSC00406_0001582 [Pleurotus cornucopiae]|uniref:Uncharacterized protein n=1 Tax=Pleurotus cornucopiae TaxID=5321 RepID=A0ACB7ILT6_PLECO|nr:hypothetical protein CCMSSC00406_0001582 [Pleurotus cornucopiae]
MSRSAAVDTLPPTARSIALLIASTPGVQDAQPGVLHQLLEFAHRYTSQIITDGMVYAEHAGRSGKLDMDDVMLAVQARVGWEFGGRIPKEHTLSLATHTNALPLPAVPEVFGVRLPPPSECLTAVDFDLVPNKPPPGVKLYDEEVEEIEESESEEEEYIEPAPIPQRSLPQSSATPMPMDHIREEAPFPISAIATPSDMDMIGTPGAMGATQTTAGDGGSDIEDEDGLFAGGDEDEESDAAMEEVQTGLATNGVKRKLVEEDDYD